MTETQSHPAPRTRWRPLLANFGLAAGSVVVLFLLWLLAEVALRLLDPRYLDRFALDDINYLHEYSESYGWVARPGFRLKPARFARANSRERPRTAVPRRW